MSMITTARLTIVVIALAFSVQVMSLAMQDTRTMTIDFLAQGSNGESPGPLSATDVSVKIGGRDAAVRSVEMIVSGGDAAAAADAAKGTPNPVPPAFGTTRAKKPATGRNILLLIDEGTLFGLEKIVKDSVAQLIASLHPDDRIGLTTSRPGGAGVSVTRNHAAVREAVNAMILGRGNAALCVGALLGQVRSLSETLPKGRATTLALISRGAGTTGSTTGSTPLSGAGNCAFRREELQPVAEAVSAAQINYYVFHVGGSGVSPNLDNFAGATGAETGMLSWSDASGLEKAIKRSSRFYRALVEMPPGGRGPYLRTEVRVNKPNVKVDAPQYVALAAPVPTFVEAADLLRGEVSRSDLPIRVAAFPSRNAGTLPIKLVVVVEPGDPKVPLTSAVVSVVGPDGEVAGQWTARRADLSRLPLLTAIPVNPGRYRVRAAAADEDARGGIAEYDVEAVLMGSGGVKMSALALVVSTASGFTPRLLFDTEKEATAYLEVYDVPPSGRVEAVFDVAATADGPAITSVPGNASPANGLHILTATLPLASIPAGDTIVRARVTIDGAPAGTVVRTLTKSGR